MNYRPAAIVLWVAVFAVLAFPAERKFDITISLEGGSVRIDRTEAVARVRVTNRGREDLRLEGLGELNLYFSSCQPGDPSCDGSELYYARVKMPSATGLVPHRPTRAGPMLLRARPWSPVDIHCLAIASIRLLDGSPFVQC